MATAFDGSAELQDALADARLPAERKQAIVSDLLGGAASPVTVNIINFVVSSGRARDLPEIATSLVEQASTTRGKTTAEVRSATDLEAATVARLEEALSRATGRPVEVRLVVDPGVIGGLVARVGDTIIDGSLRGRFESLRESLEAQ